MKKNRPFVLRNLNVHTETTVLESASVFIKEGCIAAIEKHFLDKNDVEVIDFPPHFHLVPGFIDVHVHGANNHDVMDASGEALHNISQALAKEGTTSFLATTMAAPINNLEQVLSNVRNFIDRPEINSGAKILGVHLEGPFISKAKANAQSEQFIVPVDIDLIASWQSEYKNLIKIVTLAPEIKDALQLINYLSHHEIIASLGHSDATFDQMQQAVEKGCTHATHLFNAMRGLHHREPGAVTSALLSSKVMTEIICDGIHLHPAIIQLILKLKGKDKIILVTDSMRAKCMSNGIYDLGGQAVQVENEVARLSNGLLAGSTLKMNEAIKNFMQFTGLSLFDTAKMASENPAKTLGIFDRKGSIELNKDADLTVLDNQLNVVMTLSKGEIIYNHYTSRCEV